MKFIFYIMNGELMTILKVTENKNGRKIYSLTIRAFSLLKFVTS